MASNKKTPATRAGDPLAEMEKELAALKEMLLKTRARQVSEAEKAATQAAAAAERAAKALAKAEEKVRNLAAKAHTPDQQKQLRAAQTALKAAEKLHAEARSEAEAAARLFKRLKPANNAAPAAEKSRPPTPKSSAPAKPPAALTLVPPSAPKHAPPATPPAPAAPPATKAERVVKPATPPKSVAKPPTAAKPVVTRRSIEPVERDEDELPRVIRDEKLPPGRLRSLFDPFD